MRKAEREIKEFAEIEGVIKKGVVCYLSLIDGDYPYTLPFNYGYADNKIYIHCATEGKKLDVLRLNQHCSFAISIDHRLITDGVASHCTMLYRSVCGKGKVREVTDDEEKAFSMQVLMEQYIPDKEWDFKGGCFDSVGILCVDIEEMTGKKR